MNRLLTLIALLLATLATNAASSAKVLDEPYSVWVGPTGAKVYSGPGTDYYGTQQLPEGTECQVYEELRDGWLAVRPPEGSYSLVLRSALGEVEEGLAEVIRDQTPSRIGSVVSDQFGSVHIRLEAGEVVTVLDRQGSTNSQWVTIAPPAGEFRYVRATDVTHAPARRVAQLEGADKSENWRGIEVDTVVEPAATASTDSADETIRVVTHDEPTTAPAATTTLAPAPASPPLGSAPLPLDAPFAKKLDHLEVQLSRRVAGPANLWVFDDLEREAALLMSQASTAPEQQAITSIADRLRRFSAIGDRYRSNGAALAASANLPPSSTTPTNSRPGNLATAASDITPDTGVGGFDAVGVLRPVVSKNGNAPPYALVDDSGKIVTFITPSPTLNLQQMLGQRVGVNGTRGFLPQYQNRNIQTARVAPVDGAVRR
ncbi:hypothetical protein [Aeoliella sp. SH292]|uniref:hypothetical protein n=1 Tax=Aeoliella sp. SH292 TaxID=3454464 RepID=UPI003F96D7EC